MKELTVNRVSVVLLDRQEIMDLLGVSRKTIQRAQAEGRLKSRKIGRAFYSSQDEIAVYLDIKAPANRW